MISKLIEIMMKNPLCTIEAMAEYLNIPEKQIADLICSGCFPTFGTHSQLLRVADVIQFLYPGQVIQLLGADLTYTVSKTFNEILFEMLDVKKGNLSGATLDDYYNSAKRISEFFDATLITSIKPRDLELFYQSLLNKRTGKQLSNHSIKSIRKVVNMTFRYAHLNHYLAKPFPVDAIKIAPGYITDKDSRFLSKEVVAKLLHLLENHPLYFTLTRLLISTGLRINEALALRFSDFDRTNNVLHITQALKKGKIAEHSQRVRNIIIGSVKTRAGKRDIPISSEIINMIDNWKQYIAQDERLSKLRAQKNTSHFVFTSHTGALIKYQTISNNFQGYIARHLLAEGMQLPRITFHMLRHSYGSFLLEKGIPLAAVSKFLGHENIELTADIYISITKDIEIHSIEQSNNILQEISLLCKEL